MIRWLYLRRFFAVVPPMPLLMIGAFVVVTIAAVGVIVVEPMRTAGALTPVLLLQLFSTSSGFDVPARRGHYDLLLTHATPAVGSSSATGPRRHFRGRPAGCCLDSSA